MRRTDLAMEAKEFFSGEAPEGTRMAAYDRDGFRVTAVEILTEAAAERLCKPIGRYITTELGRLLRREEDAFSAGAEAVAAELRALLALPPEGSVLVAGLGNEAITPDAVGHLTARHTLVTRHLRDDMPALFSGFRSVAVLEPGVLGTTGVESAEVIRAVTERLRPDAVIAVDALASRDPGHICSTVQMTDAGIVPGSGVGNGRAAVTRETLGVPVIALGVPTVVDAATLALDALGEADERTEEEIRRRAGGMMVTPRDIDAGVRDISKLIGYAINLALHNDITVGDIDMLIG